MTELAVVLAIVGVTAAMATSNLRGVSQGYEERAVALQVQDYLYEARSLARSLICEVTVSYENGVLLIDGSPFETRGYGLGTDVADITIGTTDGTLVYNPDGGTNEANPTNVIVTTNRGQVYRLTVYPAIGSVRMGEL